MHVVDLPTGASLALDLHGEPAAPLLVLLHGLSSSRATYAGVVAHLCEGPVRRGELQLAVVDLRGHGDSSRATLDTYDVTSYAADIAALIDAIDARPALLAGHSLGGLVAHALVQRHPEHVRAAFLEDPPLFEGDDVRRNASPVAAFFPKLVAAVRALQARDAPPADYVTMVADTTPPDEIAERADALRRWDPTCMEAAVEGVVWRGYDPLAATPRPVTVVRADPALGAVFTTDDVAPFAATHPTAKVAMIEGATHSVHATQPAAYLGALDAFLAEHTPSR